MEWFSGSTAWLIFGFGLLILETIVPGIFIMWWGFASIIVAGVLYLFPGLAFSLQAAIFAILAITFSVLWWKFQHNRDKKEDKKNELNFRDHAMIGSRGSIVEILDNGVARGKFGDTTWRVVGENLKLGDKVKVEQVEGITLNVVKV
ncbi:NfeD family protein [Glaesserella sp.]|uniref:NfeD family protein n=1 Tax=Glaesserella sp. TaxID=2094731 RepID=UPI0035A151E4